MRNGLQWRSSLPQVCVMVIWLSMIVSTLAQASNPSPSEILTNAVQVRSLSGQEAAGHLPVRLRGIFLGQTEPPGRGGVIMDQTEGIYFHGPADVVPTLERGDLVELAGVTDPGGFAPFVVAQSLKKAGRENIPEPRRVTLADLNNGGLDAQWVEVSGVVRSCEPLPETETPTPPPGTPVQPLTAAAPNVPKFKMELGWGGERLPVQINAALSPSAYVDAEVRLQGICFNQHNTSRQFLSPLLLVPRGVELVVQKPAPGDPFGIPARPVASLLQFSREGNFGHRVRVRGVITYHQPGEFLWLRDGERGLRVQSSQLTPLLAGDEVDVVGFPARGHYTPVLEEAIFQKQGTLKAPLPAQLSVTSMALKHDADLVELDAQLIEARPSGSGWTITLDWAGTLVEALARVPRGSAIPPDWRSGNRVRVAGICSVATDKSGPLSGIWEPRSFQILLRSSADLRVVQRPSWWTSQHIVMLLGLLATASLLVTAAVMLSARRHLREQATRRATAEAEFAAILSERNRMAREIHDTLAQGLVATSVHLRLAKKDAGPQASTEHLDAAQDLVRQSLQEARNSIWNMRSHVLENGDLAGALRGILKQLADGSGVVTSLQVSGRARRLAPVLENNVLRVGQEAITNATKHARARHIDVNLEFGDKQFRLRVSDDGQGFDTAKSAQGERGFGLMGMRERSAQLKGELTVHSGPGNGTEVRLTVPLSGD